MLSALEQKKTRRRDQALVELTVRAVKVLEQAETAGPASSIRGRRPKLRLWHYPAQGAYVSWTLFTPNPMVRELSWDRSGDSHKILEGEGDSLRRGGRLDPSVGLRDADVPPEELANLMKCASAIDLGQGVLQDKASTVAAFVFGLEGCAASARTRLEWSREVPPSLSEVADWAMLMRAFLRQCVKRHWSRVAGGSAGLLHLPVLQDGDPLDF